MLLKEYKKLDRTNRIVYKISNLINDKSYIGITHNLAKRIKDHVRFSINDYRIKGYIHKAINKYGIDNFKVEIICICDTDKKLNAKEVYYISFYKTHNPNYGYNLTLGGDREIPNEETILKKIKSSHKVKVGQYDLNGNLLSTFSSIKEAERVLNIRESDIHRCHKNNWSAGGFLFKKFTVNAIDKISPYTNKRAETARKLTLGKPAHNSIKCKLINKITNVIIGEGSSIEELSIKLGMSKSTLHRIYKSKTNKKWLLLKEVN